jgi:predicted DNA-binding protein
MYYNVVMKRGTTVRLPDDLRERLARVSKASGFKASDLIRRAVEDYCAKVEKTGSISVPMIREKDPSTAAENSTVS